MTTLVDFLLARIADDEAAALACPPPMYTVDMAGARQYGEYVHTILRFAPEDGVPWTADRGGGVAMHFARHDPARVLAECEAKRRIVEAVAVDGAGAFGLEYLAAVYADHPDFDERWRP